MATYFHQFKKSNPFFLDYTFTNVSVLDYELCRWEENVSDHVAQVILI